MKHKTIQQLRGMGEQIQGGNEMSELKARLLGQTMNEYGCDTKIYLKSEADKVIKSITEGAISMFRDSSRCRGLDLESPLGKIADAAYKHWMRVDITRDKNKQLKEENDRLLRNNSQLLDRIVQLEKHVIAQEREIRRRKYKRCLAMAQWCKAKYDEEDERVNDGLSWYFISPEMKYWERWERRWLELAEEPTLAKFLQLIHK